MEHIIKETSKRLAETEKELTERKIQDFAKDTKISGLIDANTVLKRMGKNFMKVNNNLMLIIL